MVASESERTITSNRRKNNSDKVESKILWLVFKPVYHLLFNSMKEERKGMINSSSQMPSKALLFSYGSEADEFNFFWEKLWKAVLFAFYRWEMPG